MNTTRGGPAKSFGSTERVTSGTIRKTGLG